MEEDLVREPVTAILVTRLSRTKMDVGNDALSEKLEDHGSVILTVTQNDSCYYHHKVCIFQ